VKVVLSGSGVCAPTHRRTETSEDHGFSWPKRESCDRDNSVWLSVCVNAKMFLERDEDCGFQSDTIPDMQEVKCRLSADREFYTSRTSNAYVIKSQLEALLGSIKHLSQEKSAAKTLLSRANITSLCSFTFDPAALDMLTTDPTRSRSQPSLALNLFLNVPQFPIRSTA